MTRSFRKSFGYLTALLLSSSFANAAIPAAAAIRNRSAESVPGEFVVKMKSSSGVSTQALSARFSSLGMNVRKMINANEGLVLVKQNQLTAQNTRGSALTALNAMSEVEFAEPNFIYRKHESLPLILPNDVSFNSLWGMHNVGQTFDAVVGKIGADIKASEAWTLHKGTGNVIVGVVDTGVDYTHSDLAANIWSSPTDANVHGINAITGKLDPMDDNEHGTHVSGTIGALGDNNLGVVGVNWHVQIMGCKFLSAEGSGSLADAITAIDWCVDNGAQVLNNSWGGGGYSEALLASITRAGEKGVLFIASSGNDGKNNDLAPSYPAGYDTPNMVSVAASTNVDGLAYFSNFGEKSVHLMAPGHMILSTVPGEKYDTFSGTSMASPHVTGAAALLWSKEPGLSVADVKARLLSSTDKIKSMRTRLITGGRLNVYNLLANINPPPFTPIPEESWTTVAHVVETPHPYADGSKLTWTIEQPGATYMKLHFSSFATEANFDKVKIISSTGEVVATYSGTIPGDFWTAEIDGDKVTVEFTSDTSITADGFVIDSFKWTNYTFPGVLAAQ